MERLAHGAAYYFVSLPYWKVCETHDAGFTTDNRRFRDGNYFPDGRSAQIAFAAVSKAHGQRLAELKALLKLPANKETKKALVDEQKAIIKDCNAIIKKSEKTLYTYEH